MLIESSTNGHFRIAEFLCKYEFNMQIKQKSLYYSSINGHFKIVELLLNIGTNLEGIYNPLKSSISIYNIINGSIKYRYDNIIEILLKYETNINNINDSLLIAVRFNIIEMVKIIIKYKPSIKSINKGIEVAMYREYFDIFKLLNNYIKNN